MNVTYYQSSEPAGEEKFTANNASITELSKSSINSNLARFAQFGTIYTI